MKAKLQGLFKAIGYMAIALYIQVTVGGVIGFNIGIFYAVQQLGGHNVNRPEITEVVAGCTPYLLIVSGVITVLVIWGIYKGKGRRFRNEILFKPLCLKQIMLSIGIGFFIWCIDCSIITFIKQAGIFQKSMAHFTSMGTDFFKGNFLAMILSVGVIAPIFEEILFRGVIYRTLSKRFSILAAIVIQALLFGLFHFNLVQGIYVTLLGIIMGYTTYRTQSLWSAIIIHSVNNIFSLCMMKVLVTPVILQGGIETLSIGVIGIGILLIFMIKDTSRGLPEMLETTDVESNHKIGV